MKDILVRVRDLVNGIALDNPCIIQEALKELLEMPATPAHDYIVIVLYEALMNKKKRLEPCSKTAAIISGLILETVTERTVLEAIADGINDPVVCEDPNWLDDIVFKDADISPEERHEFWGCIDRVLEVRELFFKAPHPDGIDERCTPKSTAKPSPTIDELCDDDEPDSASSAQCRPDPVPSDWKKDDTCTGADSADGTSGHGAPPDANTDVWPEGDVDYERYHIDEMGYINYI